VAHGARVCSIESLDTGDKHGDGQNERGMSIDRNTRGMRVGRLLRLGVSGEGSSPAEVELGELEMELALLREENARLKVERHRPPDAGRVIERMRHLGDGESIEPAAANAIDDCRAMRDGLIIACHEVQLAMQGIRGRLGELAVDLQDEVVEHVGVGDRAIPDPIAVSAVGEIDVEPAVGAQASPGLIQSAA
jgi:hypothetical protein